MEKKYQILLLILLFIYLSFVSFTFSPFFNVRDFVIHSRSEISKDSLRINLNRFYGKNMLFIDEDELKTELLKHNLISSIELEKAYPSTIHVIIEERKAVAWIENNDKKLIFSADGIILREAEADAEINLPEIEGYAYYFEKQKINFPQTMGTLLSALSNLEQSFLAEMKKIIFEDNVYKIYLASGAGVNLGGDNNLEQKFALLLSILNNNSSEDEKIDYINLQVIKHPVVKMK